MVWTLIFVITCGRLYSHMVAVAAVILVFFLLQHRGISRPVLPLIFCAGNSTMGWQHRQWIMQIHSLLSRPWRFMWFFSFSFFLLMHLPPPPLCTLTLLISSTWTKGLLVFIHRSPPPLPCLITLSSTQTRADSSALFLPFPASCLCSSLPLLSVSLRFSGSCVSLIIQDSLKTLIPRHLPWSYCTYKKQLCVCAKRERERERQRGRWDKNGGHNRGMESENQFHMHFLCYRLSISGFMLAAYTERCTSSLSYLLVQLIFSAPSEAAVHWFLHTRPKRRRRGVLANAVTKWKSKVLHWGSGTFQRLSKMLILELVPPIFEEQKMYVAYACHSINHCSGLNAYFR